MTLYAAAVVFVLGCVGTVMLYKRAGKFKIAAAACTTVSLLALLYIAAAILLVNGIK